MPNLAVRTLELRKHIRRSDNLQIDVFWDDYLCKPPTLSFEVFSFHPSLLLVIEPPICFLDIRKQEGLKSWLKCFSPVCENLHISLLHIYMRRGLTSRLISCHTSGLSLMTLLTPHLAQFLISSRPFTVQQQSPFPAAAHSFRNRSPSAEARYSYRTENPWTCLKK